MNGVPPAACWSVLTSVASGLSAPSLPAPTTVRAIRDPKIPKQAAARPPRIKFRQQPNQIAAPHTKRAPLHDYSKLVSTPTVTSPPLTFSISPPTRNKRKSRQARHQNRLSRQQAALDECKYRDIVLTPKE